MAESDGDGADYGADVAVGGKAALDFLKHPVWWFRTQLNDIATRVGFDLIEAGLDFPAPDIQPGQVFGWSSSTDEDRGD